MTALCASGGVGVSLYAGKKLDQKKIRQLPLDLFD